MTRRRNNVTPQLKVIFHEAYVTDYPTASCETPDRVEAVIHSLRQYYEVITPTPASESDIRLVHSEGLLKSVKADAGLYRAAAMAVGGAILAAKMALVGEPVFAAVRPPGHHASPNSHWGFCFFNNIAVSLEKLIQGGEISCALVLDIDLHFGDGTDNFFKGRKEVVVANIQENDRERFLKEVDRALTSHDYDIVAISAGFDRHVNDWGGTLLTEDYFTIGRNVRDYALSKCDGRYYAVLEGGYNTAVLGKNALALCRGMSSGG
ncbi:MAG: histone deacetylase family protein [Desulfomonile sp.]|nr:histone deacetylase family protein [Desulfomonile sp.]